MKRIKQIFPYLGLIFIILFFAVFTKGKIFMASNLSGLIDQCYTVTVISLGAVFVYACGQMDIGFGAVMACAELIMGRLMISGKVPLLIVILIGIGIAIVGELVIALVSTRLKVMSFIVSLCVMNICGGIVATSVANKEVYISYKEYGFLNNILLKAAVLLTVIAVCVVLFNKARLGRQLRTIGGNQTAAVQSGIQTGGIINTAFIIAGICVAIAGLFNLTYNGMVNTKTGSGAGLNVMVALVLGGFPLSGGSKAKISSGIIGALTVSVLNNGLTLMGVDPAVSNVIKGILFVVIVGISYERTQETI